jgi:hypothetical protein
MLPDKQKPVWLDAEIRDDEATLTAIMALGVIGCRCHRETVIVADVTFAGSDMPVALCEHCYQALMGIARGQVV